MSLNPYRAPQSDLPPAASNELSASWTLIAHGFVIGAWSGLAAGLVSGGMIGLLYRTFRHATFGGDGYFGMLRRIDSHFEHCLAGAVDAAIPALVIGLVFGNVQGVIARRRNIGMAGIIALAIVGSFLGLANGLNHVGNSSRFVRDFAFGPLPGLIFGGVTYAVAGYVVRVSLNRLRGIEARAVHRWIWIFGSASFLVIGATAAIFPLWRLGWSEFQIAMQFVSILSILASIIGGWTIWRSRSK